jgi:UDP-N-acetylglucosamine:LPS N-acetylglucosamine transferase
LTEVKALADAYSRYEYFYVINNKVLLSGDLQGRTTFITHSERDWKLLVNLWEAYKILRKERPNIILSAGAGPVVPFALIGRLFFRTHVIYVETITSVAKPSMTGRIMRYLANSLYYQWQSLAPYFPKGIYSGPLI